MHFGENRLSQGLIGISPLPTPQPPGIQHWSIRASTTSFLRFTLSMARSPHIRAAPCSSQALSILAIATATPPGTTAPHTATRRLILQQARHHPAPKQSSDGLTAHGFRYSFTTPHRGTFHLSLTVLVHYRSPGRIQAWQVVLPDSHGIPRAPRYSGTAPTPTATASPTGLSPAPAPLPNGFGYSNHRRARSADRAGTTPQPHARNGCRLFHARGLATIPVRSPLLRESLLFSLPAGTEMFHFPASPPTALYIQTAATRHDSGWVPPFGHPRITARLTTPRGLSRPPTSFIGAWYQGIHRMPHTLGHHRYKMLAHTIHESKHPPPTRPQPPHHAQDNSGTTPARPQPRTRTTRTPATTGQAPDHPAH